MCCFFNYSCIKKFQTLDDIKSKKLGNDLNIPKEKIKICIIDDESFPCDSLKRLGFSNITVLEDCPNDINELSEFNIVLVDVRGVATKINQKEQGLAYAKTLKREFPFIHVLLYTAIQPKILGDVPDSIPVIYKSIPYDQIALKLDEIRKQISDPKYLWGVIESYLLENGYSHRDLAIVEDIYCKSISNKIDYKEIQSKFAGISFMKKSKETTKFLSRCSYLLGALIAGYVEYNN